MKRCTKCGETKPVEEFNRDKTNKDGRCSRCKACRAHPTIRAKDRQRKTGVNKELFNALLIVQDARCAICKCPVDNSASADHCHDTKTPRGILCRRCNLGLGIMRDSLETLTRAVAYLQRPPASPLLIEITDAMTEPTRAVLRSGVVLIP
jgi:hypothetical protein